MKKSFLIICVIILLFVSIIYFNNDALTVSSKIDSYDTVILGGNAVGLRLLASGVLIVGSDRSDNKLKIGDVILEINNSKIESNDELICEIKKCNNNFVNLKILRESKILYIKVDLIKEDNENRLGLWVKDSSAGIGTITFFINNKFASLGHPVTETRENKILKITTGGITKTSIYDIDKGLPRKPR